MKNKVIWTLTILAFLFFFFSLRTKENEILYSVIALIIWGIAFLLNKFLPTDTNEKEKEEA